MEHQSYSEIVHVNLHQHEVVINSKEGFSPSLTENDTRSCNRKATAGYDYE